MFSAYQNMVSDLIGLSAVEVFKGWGVSPPPPPPREGSLLAFLNFALCRGA